MCADDGGGVDRVEIGQLELRPAVAGEVDGDEFLFEEDEQGLWIVEGEVGLFGGGLVDREVVDYLGCEIEADVEVLALDYGDRHLVRVVDARTAAAEDHVGLVVAAGLHKALLHGLAWIRAVDDVRL